MSDMTGSSVSSDLPAFKSVRVDYDCKSEDSGLRLRYGKVESPRSYVVIRNMAFFADESGFLWTCGDFDMSGEFEWDYAFNMGVSVSAQYTQNGEKVPDEIDAFLMRACAMVWDALTIIVPGFADSGR